MRTILRRLEQKGYVKHRIEGRTFIYQSVQPRQRVAVRAVKQITDRFCGGSVKQLLVGMVDAKLLDRRELEKHARSAVQAGEEKS